MVFGRRIGQGLKAAAVLAALSVLTPWAAAAPPEIRWAQGSGSGSWSSPSEQRSYLGVGVREMDTARAKEKGLAGEYGVEITKVDPDTAAEEAGLEKGDVVVEYGGRRVEGVEQFKRLVRETPVGRKVTLKVNREGKTMNLDATIGNCEKCAAMMYGGTGKGVTVFGVPGGFDELRTFSLPDIPRVFTTWRSSMLGVEAEALQSQLAGYFGVSRGVLVRSVVKGSAAEKAGFQAGDVIVKVAGSEVATPRDVTRAIQTRKQSQFDVLVMRNHAEVTLPVRLEDARTNEGRLQLYQMVSAPAVHL